VTGFLQSSSAYQVEDDLSEQAMATIRKLRSKWQAQVRIKGHKPQAKSFTLRSDAVAWARQVETEIQRGLFVDT
jgi:hypothetical protein